MPNLFPEDYPSQDIPLFGPVCAVRARICNPGGSVEHVYYLEQKSDAQNLIERVLSQWPCAWRIEAVATGGSVQYAGVVLYVWDFYHAAPDVHSGILQ